jgi:hypothetical protein
VPDNHEVREHTDQPIPILCPYIALQGMLATDATTILSLLAPRRGELSGLQPYLPADRLATQGAPVMLAGVPVHEHGPLARCAPFMDTAARRVLPGHLLRRARVLSSLQVRAAAGVAPDLRCTHGSKWLCITTAVGDGVQRSLLQCETGPAVACLTRCIHPPRADAGVTCLVVG